jgi:hypothetical protein
VSDPDDLEAIRAWHAEQRDFGEKGRHSVLSAELESAWEMIDTLLRELDRRIDPDDLDDEQTAIYESGYAAGQQAMAQALHQFARQYEGLNEESI